MKKVFAALILLSALIACASCAHFRGKVNGYYIPGDLKNFTSCRCESEGKEFEVQKKDNYLLVKTDDQTYLLSSGGGALKSEDGIKELSKEQASSALLSAVTESGLIYSAAEKDVYIMTDTSGKYRADAEKFFFADKKIFEVTEPYNPEKDVEFYDSADFEKSAQAEASVLHAGEFAVFFPDDAHKPSLITDGVHDIKKILLKIPVA